LRNEAPKEPAWALDLLQSCDPWLTKETAVIKSLV
jgi:hypothetical protein